MPDKPMTRQRAIEVCQDVSKDVEADAKNFDGRPFDGHTVAEYFGNHGAAIAALARVLQAVIEKNLPDEPSPLSLEGYWPDDCLQRAFVNGAQWWQGYHNKATAFPSERDEMEEEAVRRYGQPAQQSDRAILQSIMQALGPDIPQVDYSDPGNASGLLYDATRALNILKAAGIEYRKEERQR